MARALVPVPRPEPMWDSVLLADADRTRVLQREYRASVIARNGDVLPAFLVDGLVAGLWWAELYGTGTRIALEPFAPVAPGARGALETLAADLVRFVESREPTV